MKNWADISSDEESDDDHHHHPSRTQPAVADEPEEAEEEEILEEKPPKTYQYPSDPPFTAFVGNLAFSVDDGEKLTEEIQRLAKGRLNKSVSVVNARIAIDRRENKHRGFGYLELETVDDLKTVMELNDGKSQIKGRPIKLDVAQPPQNSRSLNRQGSRGSSRGSLPEIDGSQFRGGRFSNRGSSSSLQRQASDSSEPRQRSSLKLAPRSSSGRDGEAGGSSKDLFGGAKPRDAGTWERQQQRPGDSKKERRPSDSKNDRRASDSKTDRRSTGGRGGKGGRGRGEGRGDGRRSSRSSSSRGAGRGGKEEAKKPVEQAAPVAKAQTAPPEKTSTKKVVNKFAALQFDSDSD